MEQYDDETIKQLKSWFLEQKEKGFTLDQIKQSMIENGYDKEFCDEYIAKKAVLDQEPVTVPDNQTNDDSSQTTETNTTEQKVNPWQANKNETTTKTLSEAQKQEKFKTLSYFDKIKLIITKPKQFFDEMPQESGYKEPIMFAATNIIVLFLIALLYAFIFSASSGIDTSFASITGLTMILFIPAMIVFIVFIIIAMFGVAAINNLWFKLFKCPGTYKATVNVFLYITAINFLAIIPIVGILSILYHMYVMIVGLAKIHNISKKKTLAILLIFGILISILIIVLIILIISSISNMFSNI